MGRIARIKTSTPIPPIQCVKQRQNCTQRSMPSTLLRMLPPVVVKPETVSKSASIKEGQTPEIHSGRQPTRLKRIQDNEVATKPSLA